VVTAVSGYFGDDEACLPRVATCFGGGLGRRGEICGALSGALIAVGLRYGRRKGEGREAKERSYGRAARIVDDFRERFGTILCRELIKVDLSEPEGRETYRLENIRDEQCVEYVMTAVAAAYETIAT
jgi:C_GCAxxG_C_C family probable redox protein